VAQGPAVSIDIAPESAARHRLRLRATYASLATAGVLIAAKFVAWTGTDSVALLSSLVDSMVDAAASLVTFVAVRQAAIPPDREHRFGHGKAEPLAALGQAAFLLGSALFVIAEAVRRLVAPEPVENTGIGVAVMVFSLVVTVALVAYQRHVVKRTGSLAINADALHYSSDILMNVGVIATLLTQSALAAPVIDPLFGGAVGAYITYGAAKIGRLALTQLMDRELPDEERARIRRIAESHPEVTAVHDIRTRGAGPTAFIQLHIEMDGTMSLLHAHEISDAVETQLRAAFPHAGIIIHADPAGIEEYIAFPAPRVAAR
jgi:ferrous-iron efflux pump FieF